MENCNRLSGMQDEIYNKEQLWKGVCGELEVSVSGASFSSWIKPCFIYTINEIDSERLLIELATPTGYHQQTIDERYYGQVKKALETQTGKKCEIALVVRQREEEVVAKPAEGGLFSKESEEEEVVINGLNPKFSFENFVVGSSNNLAYAASRGVVEAPGVRHNPLFLYGGVGVGKTHLMHAIGRELAKRGLKNIMVITSEQFTNEFIGAMRNKNADAFKKRYRTAEALLIDDIQFISGKETTQEEFFHTFNELNTKGKQIVMTSDRRPQELDGVEERLVSRFLGGLAVDIGLPDYEMRLAILREKCAELKLEPEEGALDLIAMSTNTNSRELEGILMKLITFASMKGRRLSKELVEEELGVKSKKIERKLRPQEVISLIAKQFEFKNKDILGSSRKAELVRARHVAMYILRIEMGMTLQEVARLMGRSDHTTVLHAVEKMSNEFGINQIIREQIMKVKQALYT